MWNDRRMASDRHRHPAGAPARSEWLRRWAGWLVLVVLLLGIVTVAVQVGWAGWLMRHPGQAGHWVRRRWLSASAAAVFIALFVGLLAAWVPLGRVS
jgi:hypothetical protein